MEAEAGFLLKFAVQVVRERSMWAWYVGVVIVTKTLPIELSETFAGKNICKLVKVEYFTNKAFADCCPHTLQILSQKNSRMKFSRKEAMP